MSRILMVIDLYPPFIQGAERQTQMLSKQLVQRGHDVAVATVWHHGLEEREDDDGVQVHRLKGLITRISFLFKSPDWRRYHPPFPDPGIVVGLRRLINEFKPDIVQVYGWIVYSCAVALLGTNIPMVISARDYGYSCATKKLLYYGALCAGPHLSKCLRCSAANYGAIKGTSAVLSLIIGRPLLLHKTRAIHSISSFVQQMVQRDLLKRRHPSIEAIKINNLYLQNVATSPDSQYIDQLPEKPYILFVGALDMYKGLGVLLDAYQRLVTPPPLVLIGSSGPNTPKHFPKDITVLQNVPHASVMAAWKRSLFGVFPSVWPEPLGNVILEAMSVGKATIGTSPGGHTDMITDEETGLLVPAGDVSALTQAMQRLIDDAELRERLGQEGQLQMSRFNTETIVPKFEALHRRLLLQNSTSLRLQEPHL